ncbi:MAG: GatB/YqeY domain-containing protein [Arenicellales bacterium WSBS_2016_MAG_OTU3]
MSTLKDQIQQDMKDAMRAKDVSRLESIRMLRAAIQRREIDERIKLDDENVLSVVQKMIKQNRDSITQFERGHRSDLSAKEALMISHLEAYLPVQLLEEEINKLINDAIEETGANSMKDMGKIMGKLKATLQGRTDMGAVSGKIKARLSP